MAKRNTNVTFYQCEKNQMPYFAYDSLKNKWKKRWKNDPDRYIGYTSDDKISFHEIYYLVDVLNHFKMPPEKEIIIEPSRLLLRLRPR